MGRWHCSAIIIAVLFGANPTNPAVAQTADQAEILRRLQQLEQRVERLERRGASSPSRTVPQDRSVWRSIRLGMSMDQVRDLLGEPHRVSSNQYFTTWYWNYHGGGAVQFDRSGRVERIEEP